MPEQPLKIYAVAHVDFMSNELEVRTARATNWKEALVNAFPLISAEALESFPDDLEDAKDRAFDQDWLFDVTEVIAE